MRVDIICISILLIIVSIFFKHFRKFPSRGNWIYEYEKETWMKILIVVVRILLFIIGITALVSTIFFA